MEYTEDVAEAICSHIADGGSLSKFCSETGRPSITSVFRWLADNEDFSDRYARARRSSADKLADEIVAISDDPKLDPNDKRVRVDARKWVAAKLKPQTYGDKLDLNHSGEVSVRAIPDEKLDGKLGSLLTKLGLK